MYNVPIDRRATFIKVYILATIAINCKIQSRFLDLYFPSDASRVVNGNCEFHMMITHTEGRLTQSVTIRKKCTPLNMADIIEEHKEEDENEKQIMENVDFSGCNVCGEDHDTEDCPIVCAGKKVVDAAAPSRARLTLPQTLQVRDLTDGTTTVVTSELISSATQFGPFEAKRTQEFNLATKLPLKIFKNDGSFVYIDATDEWQCNWMALVAPATTHEEMNLIAYQAKDDIYFSSVKQIKPGKELRAWYAPHYGKRMGIPAPWECGNRVVIAANNDKGCKSSTARLNPRRGVKRRRKLLKQRNRKVRYYEDDDSYDEFESSHSHKEVIQQLDPKRLGFKEMREWKCSQCGDIFEYCLDFAHHLSDHYKPRQPGNKRRDAGLKRPKNYPCEICGQKFTSEKLQHRHKLRSHQKTIRELRKSQRLKTGDTEEEKVKEEKADNSNDGTAGDLDEDDASKKDDSNTKEEQVIMASDSVEKQEGTEPETIAAITAALAASGTYVEDIEMEDLTKKAVESVEKENRTASLTEENDDQLDSDDDGFDDDVDFDSVVNETSHFHDDDSSQSPSLDGSRRKGPFKCDICHKSFEKSIYLFRHIRKHTGDFTCLKCYKVFARKESMLKHQCTGLVDEGDESNAEFVCSFCNKSFCREYLLKRHLSKHTGEFMCELCGKSYTSKETLMDHSCPKYPEMERYACEICHKTFTKLKYLDKHIPVHTGVFSCAICGKWLRSNDSLVNHMRICGLVKELQNNGSAICPICREEFDDLKTFRRHMYDHTHMYACESCNARFRNKLNLRLHVCEAERTIKCEECGKEFNSIASLNRHRATHGEPRFSCDICGRSYYREEALLKHPCERAKRSRGRQQSSRRPPSLMPLICEICGSMFSSTSSLNVHKNLHGEKKFACEICNKRFHRKDLLLEHMAVHGLPEIPCPVCNKLFKTKKSLDVHLLIHDGIKRFKCQTCDKTFYQKGNLQKHEETHTPGRKHICPHCNKAFSSKEYLTIHILGHTQGKTFACPTCGRSFVKEHQLKAHRRIFHGNQAYVCKFCGLSVKLRHSLKRHLEKKHANVRSEWDSNEQIASMLMQRVAYEENEEGVVNLQQQETIITEMSPTQGAEVLLAVAGIGSEAWQQAIANGTARIQQGPSPNTIEISLPVESGVFQEGIYHQEHGEEVQGETIIQHVLSDDGNIEVPEEIHIAVSEQNDINTPQIVLDDQEQEVNEGNTIVLDNRSFLPDGAGNNQGDLLLYVLASTNEQ